MLRPNWLPCNSVLNWHNILPERAELMLNFEEFTIHYLHYEREKYL
jgi:hypothetical protein